MQTIHLSTPATSATHYWFFLHYREATSLSVASSPTPFSYHFIVAIILPLALLLPLSVSLVVVSPWSHACISWNLLSLALIPAYFLSDLRPILHFLCSKVKTSVPLFRLHFPMPTGIYRPLPIYTLLSCNGWEHVIDLTLLRSPTTFHVSPCQSCSCTMCTKRL